MKNIIATTALVLMMSTSAHAASHMSTIGTIAEQQQGDILASNFIGMRIYATETDVDVNARVKADSEKEWDDIGEVNDVVLGKDGTVKAVILGVGGFLGIGEKDVSVSMNEIKMVREEGDSDDYFLVVNTNKSMLESAPAYKRLSMKDHAKDQTAMENNEPLIKLERPLVEREGYSQPNQSELTASELEGARVYGANDEDVGEINRLLLKDDGQIKEAVLDIGGFLGIGEHRIAVTLDELNIQRDSAGNIRVFIDATESNLKKKPAYNG